MAKKKIETVGGGEAPAAQLQNKMLFDGGAKERIIVIFEGKPREMNIEQANYFVKSGFDIREK